MTNTTITNPAVYFDAKTYRPEVFRPIMAEILRRFPTLSAYDPRDAAGTPTMDRSFVSLPEDACFYWGVFCSSNLPLDKLSNVAVKAVIALFKTQGIIERELPIDDYRARCGFAEAVMQRMQERKCTPVGYLAIATAALKELDDRPDLEAERKQILVALAEKAYATVLKMDSKHNNAKSDRAWLTFVHTSQQTDHDVDTVLEQLLPLARKGNPSSLRRIATLGSTYVTKLEPIADALHKGIKAQPEPTVLDAATDLAHFLYNADAATSPTAQGTAISLFTVVASKGHVDALGALTQLLVADGALNHDESASALDAVLKGLAAGKLDESQIDEITQPLIKAGVIAEKGSMPTQPTAARKVADTKPIL